MEYIFGEYVISSDKSLLSLDRITELLHKTYWADQRSIETFAKSIENSYCFGVYYNNSQIGFARLVTDYATMYWLCDVIIDENHKGKGLGKELIRIIVESDEFKNLRGILATKDAHGLYQQYGFEKAAEGRFMLRPNY